MLLQLTGKFGNRAPRVDDKVGAKVPSAILELESIPIGHEKQVIIGLSLGIQMAVTKRSLGGFFEDAQIRQQSASHQELIGN